MDNQQDSAQGRWAARLCPECGLCCNGVLFADVRLVHGEDAVRLGRQGLGVSKKRGGFAFTQPCACFDGHLCRIYASRPVQCRDFECYTLQQVCRGEVTLSEALQRIRRAQRLVRRVMRLLRAMDRADEHLALTRRYRAVMSKPISLSASDDEAEQRGELMLAMHDLMECLHQDFLNRQTTP